MQDPIPFAAPLEPMKKNPQTSVPKVFRKAFAVLLVSAGLSVVLISCASLNRTVMAPPGIPGATFVGSKTCAECHEDIVRDFKTADHARLQAKGPNAVEMGCESCHGPGSLHNQAGGGRRNIINPLKSPTACFQCHLDKQSRFSLPHHHPVMEGKVSCTDCHHPHKGPAVIGGGTAGPSESDTCAKCHVAQQGPFVFEHQALREGCLMCHDPHGSVNAKMLVQRNASLCLKCHYLSDGMMGDTSHSTRLSRGTCWSAGCHEAVHGSQVSSSLRY